MVLRIDLGGPALEFVKVGDREYAAELDGKRVPIRYRLSSHQVSEGGGSSSDGTWTQGETMKIYSLDEVHAAAPEREGDRFVLRSHQEHHFRAYDTNVFTIWLADGFVHVDHAWEYQNDSYY